MTELLLPNFVRCADMINTIEELIMAANSKALKKQIEFHQKIERVKTKDLIDRSIKFWKGSHV